MHNMMSSNTTLIPADRQDPLLVNPWGLAASAGSPWWPVNQGSNTSTIVNASGAAERHAGADRQARRAASQAPARATSSSRRAARPTPRRASSSPTWAARSAAGATAITNNDALLGFASPGRGLHGPGDRHGRRRAAALRGRSAQAQPRRHGLQHVGKIAAGGAFVDPNLPAGYGAYGVQTVGNRIIVTYARQPAGDPPRASTARSRAPASAWSTRSTSTASSSRASRRPGGVLNAPWGTALAATRTSAPTAATC